MYLISDPYLFAGTCSSSCLFNAQQLLFAIFILRFLLNIEEVLHPYLRMCYTTSAAGDTGDMEERQALNSGEPSRRPLFDSGYGPY